MNIEDKRNELMELSKFINFNISEEKLQKITTLFYNADFLIVNDRHEFIDRNIKRFIKRIGRIKESSGNFYQLFYYFSINFNEDNSIKLLMLNSEINKFIDILKKFFIENSDAINKSAIEMIENFTFENKSFIEDYKVLAYKSNLKYLLKKYDIAYKLVYKSGKHLDNIKNEKFDIIKNDEFKKIEENGMVNNSKLNVISNFLYMMKDLNMIDSFN